MQAAQQTLIKKLDKSRKIEEKNESRIETVYVATQSDIIVNILKHFFM